MNMQLRMAGHRGSMEEASAAVLRGFRSGTVLEGDTRLLNILQCLIVFDTSPASVVGYRDCSYRLTPDLKRRKGVKIDPLVPVIPSNQGTSLSPHTASKLKINAGTLRRAQSTLGELSGRIPHSGCVRHVAGWNSRTTCGLVSENERLHVQATTADYGSDAYNIGLLPDIPVWYVDAELGDLVDQKPGFSVYGDAIEWAS